MNEQALLKKALELGFANAALVDTADVTFIPAFRPLCQENLCGKYGVNYACPPDCGTVEEMRRKLQSWPRALVMQTMWDIDDAMDERQTKPAKGQHNRLTRQLIDWAGAPGLMVGASGCSLCSPCAITQGEPCRFPERACPSMEGYGLLVNDACGAAGVPYYHGSNTLAYTACYLFPTKTA